MDGWMTESLGAENMDGCINKLMNRLDGQVNCWMDKEKMERRRKDE